MIHVKSRRVKLIELCEPMVPAREAAMRGFTMAILVTLSALGAGQPVAAEDPLPAGYERWMAPDAKHVRTGGSTQSYSGVWFNIGFNKGSFIVDFDVTSYDPKPTTKDNSGDLYYKDHVFSALEVTNKGLLGVGETNGKPNDWVFAYGQNEEGMAWVLGPGGNPESADFGFAEKPKTKIEIMAGS